MTPGLLHFGIFLRYFANFQKKIRPKTLLKPKKCPDCYTFVTFFCNSPRVTTVWVKVKIRLYSLPWIVDCFESLVNFDIKVALLTTINGIEIQNTNVIATYVGVSHGSLFRHMYSLYYMCWP